MINIRYLQLKLSKENLSSMLQEQQHLATSTSNLAATADEQTTSYIGAVQASTASAPALVPAGGLELPTINDYQVDCDSIQ